MESCLYGLPARQNYSGSLKRYVSHSTVDRLVHLYQTTGDVRSLQDKHGPERKLSEFEELTVLQSFLNNQGIHLNEVQQELLDITGTWVCLATICKTAH